jgi:hypothetical protein
MDEVKISTRPARKEPETVKITDLPAAPLKKEPDTVRVTDLTPAPAKNEAPTVTSSDSAPAQAKDAPHADQRSFWDTFKPGGRVFEEADRIVNPDRTINPGVAAVMDNMAKRGEGVVQGTVQKFKEAGQDYGDIAYYGTHVSETGAGTKLWEAAKRRVTAPVNDVADMVKGVGEQIKRVGEGGGNIAYYVQHSDEPGASAKLANAVTDVAIDGPQVALTVEGLRGAATDGVAGLGAKRKSESSLSSDTASSYLLRKPESVPKATAVTPMTGDPALTEASQGVRDPGTSEPQRVRKAASAEAKQPIEADEFAKLQHDQARSANRSAMEAAREVPSVGLNEPEKAPAREVPSFEGAAGEGVSKAEGDAVEGVPKPPTAEPTRVGAETDGKPRVAAETKSARESQHSAWERHGAGQSLSEQIQAELEEFHDRAQASGDVEADLLGSGLNERPEFQRPTGSSKIVNADSPGAKADTTFDALMEHVTQAQKRFYAEGFTEAQTAAIEKAPTEAARSNARARFYGERMDTMVKESIAGDRRLDHLGVSEIKQPGPDFFDPANDTWYDITTASSWDAHVKKYGSGGRGVFVPSGR